MYFNTIDSLFRRSKPFRDKYGIFGQFGGICRIARTEEDSSGGGGANPDNSDSDNAKAKDNSDSSVVNTESTDSDSQKGWDKDKQRHNEIKGLNKKIFTIQSDYDEVSQELQSAQERIAELEQQSDGDTARLTAEDLEDYEKASQVIIELKTQVDQMAKENKKLISTVQNQQEVLSNTARQQQAEQGMKWVTNMCEEFEGQGFSQAHRNQVLADIQKAVTETKGFAKLPVESRRKIMRQRAEISYMTLAGNSSSSGKEPTASQTNQIKEPKGAILDTGGSDYGQPAIKPGLLDDVIGAMKERG